MVNARVAGIREKSVGVGFVGCNLLERRRAPTMAVGGPLFLYKILLNIRVCSDDLSTLSWRMFLIFCQCWFKMLNHVVEMERWKSGRPILIWKHCHVD